MADDVWQDHEHRLVRIVVRAAGRIAGRAATLDGGRKPLAWLEGEFFAAMSEELEDAGVKRRVAAQMFGTSRRTLQRRLSRVYAGLGEVGNSLWWQVNAFLAEGPTTTPDVLSRFSRRPPDIIEAILRDMEETGWVANEDGTLVLRSDGRQWTREQFEQFVEAHTLFSNGRLTAAELADYSGLPVKQVQGWLDGLNGAVHIEDARAAAKWLILAKMIEAVLHMTYQRIAGDEGGDGQLWRAQFADEHRAKVRNFRAAVAQKAREIESAYRDAVEQIKSNGSTDAYVVTLCEVDQSASGWADL